jgi:predicted exporter
MQSGTLSRRYILSIDAGENKRVESVFLRQLIEQLSNIPGVEDIWSPGQSRVSMDALQTFYTPHSTHLFSRHPDIALDNLFTEQGLQNRAALVKKALLSPQSAIVKNIVKQDPLLLSLDGFQAVSGQIKQVLKQQPQYQHLILETAMSGFDVEAQKNIQKAISAAFIQTLERGAHDYQLDMTGVPVFAATTQGLITGDITRVSMLSSIALSVLFLWLFRSFSALFWIAAILLTVVSVAVIITNVCFGYVHGMTMAIGTTLVGICIDYPIHGLVHAQTVKTRGRRLVIARIWPSMVLGGLTTVIGYLALGFSGYPGFQQIAVYAGSGILTALLLTRYILPGLISATPASEMKIFFIQFWMKNCARYRSLFLSVLLFLVAIAIVGIQSLHWMEDMQQLTPELDHLKAKDQEIRSRMISSIEPGRFILVTATDPEIALQKAEQVYRRLDQLQQQDQLTDYFGLFPWLLSQQQQRLNDQLLHVRLTEENEKIWQQALAKQGLSTTLLGNLEYTEQPPVTADQLLASPIKRIVDNQLIIYPQQTLLMIWIAQHEPEALATAFDDMEGVQYFSQRDILNDMAADYRQRAEISLAVGLLVIFLLLWLRYQRLMLTLQTLLPAVIAALFILSGWSFSGQAISFLHLVGLLLAVAICVDYGIFYRENRGANLELTYQAMAASMLTSAMAFACLTFANTAALQTLGQVVASGVVLGFLLCPVIIKEPLKS